MCEFCDGKGKRIKNGFTYGRVMINKMHGLYILRFDNSGNEYGYGQVEINYCPICGRKLMEE